MTDHLEEARWMQPVIAEVLRAHRKGPQEYDRIRQRVVVSCWGCPRVFRDADDHAGHQSEVVVGALAAAAAAAERLPAPQQPLVMHEEWRVEGECSDSSKDCDHYGEHGPWSSEPTCHTREEAQALPLAKSPDAHIARRFVSDWERA